MYVNSSTEDFNWTEVLAKWNLCCQLKVFLGHCIAYGIVSENGRTD